MDQNPRNHHNHPLGVNRLGKSIRKSPLHQSNFHNLPPEAAAAAAALPPAPPQPQVYNISKSDFRSIVQQLTGSPARDPAGAANISDPARPPPPKPPSSRLMRIRPPPLTPIPRPLQAPAPIANPNTVFFPRPADSPVSAYMKYLESSLFSADSSKRSSAQGLLPVSAPLISPRGNPNHPVGFVPGFMQPGLLPSPNSLLPLPSPSSFLNLVSPKSPYAAISPGFQYPQAFASNFLFSPVSQSGILGPGPGSQVPSSPSLLFPPSPSGFLPLLSPRWREM